MGVVSLSFEGAKNNRDETERAETSCFKTKAKLQQSKALHYSR